MSENTDLKVVVGLGKSGLSCVRYLKANGYNVAVTDSRTLPPGLLELEQEFPDVATHLGGFDESILAQASELIVSPGVSTKEPEIAKQRLRGIPVIGDIELFAKHTTKPVVAITGSNGKSTVTSLVGHLAAAAGLKVKVGGNLGIPVLDLLDDANTDLYVLELSSFQLETTYSLRCQAAVNLNISADHMDRYSSLEEYIQAKLRIYQHAQHPVINLDDSRSYEGYDFTVPTLGFTLSAPPAGVFGLRRSAGESYLAHGGDNLIPTQSLLLKGQHQYANVLAALALGYNIGLPMAKMVAALPSFQGLAHRCQWVSRIGGVDWYNDSKATNIGSALAAIEGIGQEISGKMILLAGGIGKNADFTELKSAVSKYVRTLILFGQDKQLIANALAGAAPTCITTDLATAIQEARNVAQPGDVVILCPACASFDMFQNFEHRGEVFTQLVRELSA